MRENGLNARRRRKFIPATTSNHGLAVCDNLLNRRFQAERAGEKRASDILRTTGGWVYLTAALDRYDRKVIGRTFSADMETVHTAVPAMEMAFANRKDQEGLIFHSDRGCGIARKVFVSGWKCPARRYARA
jgi:transposase InsO family protein